jgi:predicted O-methyltransferase YrrM
MNEELKQKITINASNARLFSEDYDVLAKYAALVEPPNWCIDIGTYMGASAETMAVSSKPGVSIYSVDMRELTSKELKEKYKGKIVFDLQDSAGAGDSWNSPIGLLFIDGDHAKMRRDFNAWYKNVIPGGYILFHDFHPSIPWVIKDCMDVINQYPDHKILHWPDTEAIWKDKLIGIDPRETVIFQIQKPL